MKKKTLSRVIADFIMPYFAQGSIRHNALLYYSNAPFKG